MHVNRAYWVLLLAAAILAGYWAGMRLEEQKVAQLGSPPAGTANAAGAEPSSLATAPEALSTEAPPPLPASLDADEENNIAVYERTSPAVVNITTQAVEMDFFFRAIRVEGAGSGFIVDQEGHIVTNNHVVENAQQIQVTLADRTTYEAEVVGTDPLTDLAVLKINARGRRLPTVPVGDSSRLRVGQKVLAIGNPFGFQGTLTTGVISALERTIETERGGLLDEAIQTDAAINSGNSGGPLLNSSGQVIGVNTIIIDPSRSGGSVGIGFAIPANTVKFVVNDLLRAGRVRRGWLGIEPMDLWPTLAEELGLPVERGVLIQRVFRGSAADEAGLRGGERRARWGLYTFRIGGDVIVAVNGEAVESTRDINRIVYKKRPGEQVTVEYYRDGRKRRVNLTLGERPAQPVRQ